MDSFRKLNLPLSKYNGHFQQQKKIALGAQTDTFTLGAQMGNNHLIT